MIARHYQKSQEFLIEDVEWYEESWGDVLEALQNRPADNLGSEFREALKYFVLTVVGGLEKDRILRALGITKSIGIANFMFATHNEEVFTMRLPDASFELTGQSITAYTDIETWLSAYFSTLIAGDNAGIEALCAVPEQVHRQADLKPDDFGLAFVRAVKGLHDPDAKIGQLLIEATEASHPDRLSDDRFEYVDRILYPLLPLYTCILSSDQADFNEKLEEAVLEHKAFWSADEHHYNTKGWISLPLTAVSGLAFDHKGFEMTFETEYIPAWMVRREFYES
jgi:hypothetical protein